MRRILVHVRLLDDSSEQVVTYDHTAGVEIRDYVPGGRLQAALDASNEAFKAAYAALRPDQHEQEVVAHG